MRKPKNTRFHCFYSIFYSNRLNLSFRCCERGFIEANHDQPEITCVPSSNSESPKNSAIPISVDMQCNKPFELKKIHWLGNNGANDKLVPYIAKLDNNGTHLTLSYAESDPPGYDNVTLELDVDHYCVRYFFSSIIS